MGKVDAAVRFWSAKKISFLETRVGAGGTPEAAVGLSGVAITGLGCEWVHLEVLEFTGEPEVWECPLESSVLRVRLSGTLKEEEEEEEGEEEEDEGEG